MSPRHYLYVGPAEIKQRAQRDPNCIRVAHRDDLLPWSVAFLSPGRVRGRVTATFVIDTEEQLWIADRHSEHVACADGRGVLAAGEMVFERDAQEIEVIEVSNQSTGYCPEPSCWEVIARVLDRVGLYRPTALTHAFEFRRCDRCGSTNLIKDEVFECDVCQSALSAAWNYAADS